MYLPTSYRRGRLLLVFKVTGSALLWRFVGFSYFMNVAPTRNFHAWTVQREVSAPYYNIEGTKKLHKKCTDLIWGGSLVKTLSSREWRPRKMWKMQRACHAKHAATRASEVKSFLPNQSTGQPRHSDHSS